MLLDEDSGSFTEFSSTSDSEVIELKRQKRKMVAGTGSQPSKSTPISSLGTDKNGGQKSLLTGEKQGPKRMTPAEFSKRAAMKPKAIPKIPTAAGVAIMMRLKDIEASLAAAVESDSFLSEETGKMVALTIYLMLIHERETFLQIIREAAGTEPASKIFPNITAVGIEVLLAADVPWAAFQSLVERLPVNLQDDVKSAKLIPEAEWAEIIDEPQKPLVQALTVFTDYIGIQLNERAITAKAGLNPTDEEKPKIEDKAIVKVEEKSAKSDAENILKNILKVDSKKKEKKRKRGESPSDESERKRRKQCDTSEEEDSVEQSGASTQDSDSDSNSASDKTPIVKKKKNTEKEVVLEAAIKREESNGTMQRVTIKMYYNGREMRVKRPHGISFDQATDLLVKKGKGPARQAIREITPLIPKAKQKRYRWASLVIAASGHDLSSITAGSILCKEIKKGERAATSGLIKACLKDISSARPQELNSRKAALFILKDSKEQKASDQIVDLAVKGVTSRFDWAIPENLVQPVPFFLNIMTKMISSLHGVSILHNKNIVKDLDDILDLNDNCQVRDSDSFLSEIEEMVRQLHRMEYCVEDQKPIQMARAALSRALKKKEKNEPVKFEGKGYAKNFQAVNVQDYNWYDGMPWAPWSYKGKGKEWQPKGKNGKQSWTNGKDQVKFDNVAWLRKIDRYQAVDANGAEVEIKPLLFCRWVESRSGCRGTLANGQNCQFAHDKRNAFVVRANQTVDAAFEVFIRWAATRGYVVTERPADQLQQQKGKGKGKKGNEA